MNNPQTQIKFNPIDLWLESVAYSHSGSQNTQEVYRRNFQRFLDFIGKTATDIKSEYDQLADFNDFRKFKDRYADYLKAWIGNLRRQDYTNASIRTIVSAVQSFFKYHDLPISYVPTAQDFVVYHNRDITKEEISQILAIATPRDRAFFAVMAQSGLRPHELVQLRIKHLQPDLDRGVIPMKIEVPQEIAKGRYRGYFTFIGSEAFRHLKHYLASRPNLSPESFVFTAYGTEKQARPKIFSQRFHKYTRKLKAKGLLKFEQKAVGKPAELRLYSLRKFFKKFSRQAGEEYQEFWMGHVGKGVTDHYLTKDPEYHRKLYAEKAMPFLRIEETTPTETEKVIAQQAEEIEKLKRRVAETADIKKELATLKAQFRQLLKRIETAEKQQS